MTGPVTREVSVELTRPLRNRVLRPAWEPGRAMPYDADPTARHVAAFDGAAVVGCATVLPAPVDGAPAAWQLRGMAVDPDRQGQGIGRLVLTAAVELARGAGASLLWANGRVSALGFYERLGWRADGDVFAHGESGLPHRLIRFPL